MIMALIMNGVVPQIFKFVENFSGFLFDDPALNYTRAWTEQNNLLNTRSYCLAGWASLANTKCRELVSDHCLAWVWISVIACIKQLWVLSCCGLLSMETFVSASPKSVSLPGIPESRYSPNNQLRVWGIRSFRWCLRGTHEGATNGIVRLWRMK